MIPKQTTKSLSIDGRKINYTETGRGKPILLFPGLSSSYSMWNKIIPHLAKNHKVYAFNLPFYGTCNHLGHRYTFHTLPNLIEKIISQLHIKRPVLGGHSLGAVISAGYASQHPKSVRSLLLVSAPFSDHSKPLPLLWTLAVDYAMKSTRVKEIIGWLENNPEILTHLCEVLLPKDNPRRVFKAAEDLLRNIPIKAMARCYHDLFNWSFKNNLEKIKIPTLFVSGTEDQPINLFNGTALYNVVPNAEVITIPGGHFLPSDNPSELSKTFSEFLSKTNS